MDTERTVDLNVEAWVDTYGDALFHFALARVKDRAVAEELVQETFLAALRSQSRFKGLSSEKTWLFSILKHKVIDHFRRTKATLFIDDVFDHPDDMDRYFRENGAWEVRPGPWHVDPEAAHDTKAFLDYFYQCLAGLPQRTADVFVHREIDGLSTEEICEEFGISASNCWTMVYRARMLLRKCLETYE